MIQLSFAIHARAQCAHTTRKVRQLIGGGASAETIINISFFKTHCRALLKRSNRQTGISPCLLLHFLRHHAFSQYKYTDENRHDKGFFPFFLGVF